MLIGTQQRIRTFGTPEINAGGTDVELVYTFKYLGIMLDQHLKYDAPVSYLCHKVFTRLKALGRVR